MTRRLALLFALLCTACRAPPVRPPRAAPGAEAVAAIFGRDDKPPPAREGPLSPWQKHLTMAGQAQPVAVWLSYEDRQIAEQDGRIYEGASPFALPAGVYTYVVLPDGATSFGHPIDDWEVGTRHAHVAQRRPVVAAGELASDGRGRLRFNVLSGTYALPMIHEGIWQQDDLRRRTLRWFDLVLRERFAPAPGALVEEALQNGTDAPIFDVTLQHPAPGAVKRLCAFSEFDDHNPALCASIRAQLAHGYGDSLSIPFPFPFAIPFPSP